MEKKKRPGYLKRYAEHAGIALSSAAEQLKRVGIDYSQQFDFAEADRRREAARHASRIAFAKPIGSDPLADDDLEDNAKKDETILEHQREREKWKAKIAQLDYEERIAKLILAEDVDKEWFELARLVRDSMLNIPARVAGKLLNQNDTRAIEDIIESEIQEAIEALIKKERQAA